MIGFGILRNLLDARPAKTPAGFVHVQPDVADAIDCAKRVRLETLACIGDGMLSRAARDAIARGHDIAWIGMKPKDVRTNADGFVALVDMRIAGEHHQRRVMLTADAEGRITNAVSVIEIDDEQETRP